jgi:hypothetical protein
MSLHQAGLTSAVGLEIKLSSIPTDRMRGRCARFSHASSLTLALVSELEHNKRTEEVVQVSGGEAQCYCVISSLKGQLVVRN